MTVAIEVAGAGAVDLEELGPVYTAVFSAPPHSEPDDSGLRRRLSGHRGRPGFSIALARADGRLVGFAYGLTGERGDVWTERVVEALGDDRAAALLGGHFELVELAVLPDERGRGIGTALLRAVLRDRPEPRVLLQTLDADGAAGRLYAREGFRPLVPMPGGSVAMLKPLA